MGPVQKTASAPWLVIRHLEHEHIGTIASVLAKLQIPYRYLNAYRGESVPTSMTGLAGLILMGGPMGVYEADLYPYLTAEMNLVQEAGEHSLPVLGICLGSQLIAGALGAHVYSGPQKEIGWHPVDVVKPNDPLAQGLPPSFPALHWHGDTFDLPAGAERLFRSQLYQNQGFRFGGNIYALQFHFEINAGMVDDWLADKGCQREIAAVPGLSADIIRAQTQRHAANLERLSKQVFTRFFTTVALNNAE